MAAFGTIQVPVTCPDCEAVIDIPVHLTGTLAGSNLTMIPDVDTTPAWDHWESNHMQTKEK